MEKKINLVPPEVRRERRFALYKKALAAAAVVYLAVLAGLYLHQRSLVAAKRAEVETLAAEKAALAARSERYRELTVRLRQAEKTEAEIRARLASAEKISTGRVSWATVLKKLSHDVPEGVWLRALSTSDAGGAEGTGEKKVRFLGSAIANTAIAEFIFTLENSGYFTAVDLSYSQRREFDSTTVYDFEVFAGLRRAEEVIHGW